MMNIKTSINKAALNGLYWSNIYKCAPSAIKGRGLIFTLHQVGEAAPDPFSPNGILKISPAFLEETIKLVRAMDYDIIAMDQLRDRLSNPKDTKPFVLFTLDDGYRDNRENALPVFEKHGVPFLIYIVSDYSSKTGELWWTALEEVIRQNKVIKNPFANDEVRRPANSDEQQQLFRDIYWPLRQMDQVSQRRTIRRFASDHGVDIDKLTTDLIMNWDELRELQKHPLVTLGAHTKSHYAVGCLQQKDAVKDITAGLERHIAELGETPRHFAYPYGDPASAGQRDFSLLKELGFETAVTTRKGLLFNEHKNHLTALPRISLNGDYQNINYVKTYLSGWPFIIANKGRQLNVS